MLTYIPFWCTLTSWTNCWYVSSSSRSGFHLIVSWNYITLCKPNGIGYDSNFLIVTISRSWFFFFLYKETYPQQARRYATTTCRGDRNNHAVCSEYAEPALIWCWACVFLYINLIGSSYQCVHPTHYWIVQPSQKGFVCYVQKEYRSFCNWIGSTHCQ